MKYLISGSSYGINDFCIGVKCDCNGDYECYYTQPCTPKTTPCTCESDFCGAEVCYPVKMEPLSKKRNL